MIDFIKRKLEPLTYGNGAARNLKDDCAFFSSINKVENTKFFVRL